MDMAYGTFLIGVIANPAFRQDLAITRENGISR